MDQLFYGINFVKDPNNGLVNDLSLKQLDTLKPYIFVNRDQLETKAEVYETLHGHIVNFKIKEGRYIPGNECRPGRVNQETIGLFTNPAIRWVEFGTDFLRVGI